MISASDGMAAAAGPARAMMLANVEAATLLSRRAQAYMELPKTLARCRNGQDVMQEQLRFWQSAWEQYQDATVRIATAWSQAAAPMRWQVPGYTHQLPDVDAETIRISQSSTAPVGRPDRGQRIREAA